MRPRIFLRRLLRPADYDTRTVPRAPAVAASAIARRFWPYARPFARWLAFGLVLLCLTPAIDTLERDHQRDRDRREQDQHKRPLAATGSSRIG